MTGTRRGAGGVLVLAALSWAAPVLRGQDTRADYTRGREQQKEVRGDTEQTVRRIRTMLRVLDYYRLDERAERRLLGEASATLAGLSRKEMAEVIARLEAAARARAEGK